MKLSPQRMSRGACAARERIHGWMLWTPSIKPYYDHISGKAEAERQVDDITGS